MAVHKFFLLSILFFADSAAGVYQQEPRNPEVARQMREARVNAARERGFYMPNQAPYTELRLPRPINLQQLRRYAQILGLSDAQYNKFAQIYNIYREEDWSLREKHIQPLADGSGEFSLIRNRDGLNAEAGQIRLQLVYDRTIALAIVFERENQIFSDMAPFLTQPQIERFDLARSARTCDRWREFHNRLFPGADLDLALTIFLFQEQGMDVIPRDTQQFQIVLDQYIETAAALFDNAQEVFTESVVLNTPIYVDYHEHGQELLRRWQIDEIDPAESAKQGALIRERMYPQFEKQYEVYMRLYEHNLLYLQKLCDLLSPDTSMELRRWFQESAYPVIYPDPFDAEIVFDLVLGHDNLSIEQRTIIEAISQSFVDRRESLSTEMIRQYIDWRGLMKRTSRLNEQQYAKYVAVMRGLQSRRRQNAEENLAVLVATLTTEQLSQVQKAIDEFNSRAAEFDYTTSSIPNSGHEWPGPID